MSYHTVIVGETSHGIFTSQRYLCLFLLLTPSHM